jgi:hypothetical protein
MLRELILVAIAIRHGAARAVFFVGPEHDAHRTSGTEI